MTATIKAISTQFRIPVNAVVQIASLTMNWVLTKQQLDQRPSFPVLPPSDAEIVPAQQE